MLRRAAGVGLAAVLVFGAIPAIVLGLSLVRAQDSLTASTAALRADDLNAARTHIDRARSAASTAESVSRAPLFQAVAGWVGLGDDLDALHVLASVLVEGTEAGSDVMDEAGTQGDDGLAATLYDDGRIDLGSVQRLERALSSAGDVFDRASASLAAAPTPALGIVDDALERATSEIDDARNTIDTAVSVFGVLPGLAAEGGSRRYLLAFQSPSEARGGGGLIGVYGILSVTDGRLSLERVGPIEDLVARLDGSVEAPRWFEHLYGNFRATSEFRMANMSPHFPTTAALWLRMYRRATGAELDGVIALDPIALGELTVGTGPLRAEGWDRQIDRENVRRVLLHDVYRHFDFKERIQNQYLRELVDVLWERLESPDLIAAAMLRAVGDATRKQHLKFFSVDAEEQSVLADLGAAGDYWNAGPASQLLFNNNFAANKVDYFLHRTTETSVSLNEDGSADVDVEITLTNEAPDEPGSVLVRPLRDELPSGINDMILYLVMPSGALPISLTVDGTETNVLRGREGDHPVAWQLVDIDPQTTESVIVSYRWPRAVADGSFDFALWPQATARPDSYSVTVSAPPGSVLVDRKGSSHPEMMFEGVLREPFELALRIVSD